MKTSNKKITINHNAKKLFEIVLDLEKYPEFIPWCTSMQINSKKKNEILADMYVLYSFILPQKFGSHVIYDKKKLNIQTIYIDGPLRDLKTVWNFESVNNKCKWIGNLWRLRSRLTVDSLHFIIGEKSYVTKR